MATQQSGTTALRFLRRQACLDEGVVKPKLCGITLVAVSTLIVIKPIPWKFGLRVCHPKLEELHCRIQRFTQARIDGLVCYQNNKTKLRGRSNSKFCKS